MPKMVFLTDEQYAAERQAVADRCERFEVVGENGIRDSITRETMVKREFVMLDPETVQIPLLIRSGAVKPAPVQVSAKADGEA